MSTWCDELQVGATLVVVVHSGAVLQGEVLALQQDWLVLATSTGRLALARSLIMAIGLDGDLPGALSPQGRRRGGSAVGQTGQAPQFEDISLPPPEVLRSAINALLDGADIQALQEISGLSRPAIGHLRKAFECARGNMAAEDLPRAAQRLVEPLRDALAG